MTTEPNFMAEAVRIRSCINQLSESMQLEEIVSGLQKMFMKGVEHIPNKISNVTDTTAHNVTLPSGCKMKIKENNNG